MFLSSRTWIGDGLLGSQDMSRTPPEIARPLAAHGRCVKSPRRVVGPFLEANDTADLVPAADAEAQVDHVRFGVPGQASTAGDRPEGRRQLRRRAVGGVLVAWLKSML